MKKPSVAAIALLFAFLHVPCLAAVREHICVPENDGVACWGDNSSGQLGRSGTGYIPAFVDGFGPASAVTDVATGGTHSCAVSEGDVYCWGDNATGQLGRPGDTSEPALVQGLPDAPVLDVAAGDAHSCAALSSSVYCWGNNLRGQLGDGGSAGGAMPVLVSLPVGAAIHKIAAGAQHTCAAYTYQGSSRLSCWGDNTYGQVGTGNGGAASYSLPQATLPPSFAPPASALSAGGYHSCAVINGTSFCWGSNARGQLGDGTLVDKSLPSPNQLMGGVQNLVAGHLFGCAIGADAAVRCWGANDLGQVGDGSIADRKSPGVVLQTGVAPGPADKLVANGNVACAHYASGWRCWGSNAVGQLGMGVDGDALSPVSVVDNTDVPVLTFGQVAIDGGAAHTCLLGITDATLACFGSNRDLQLSELVPIGEDVSFAANNFTAPDSVQLALFDHATCLRTTIGGSINCFGRNSSGQLGDGTFVDSGSVFSKVVSFETSTQFVAAGSRHGCGIRNNALSCWGNDGYGQLGDGLPEVASPTPVAVTLPNAPIKVSAGEDHSCAVYSNGLRCWGDNLFGQLGDGTFENRNEPAPYTEVPGLTGASVKLLESGKLHNCVALTSSGLRCWGYNEHGELGIPPSLREPFPVEPMDTDGLAVDALAIGAFHNCILVQGGVQCWGLNDHGQLGNGTRTSSAAPQWVTGLGADSGVTAIGAGTEHTCAAVDGQARCWGNRLFGRLGDGERGYRMQAVAIVALPTAVGGSIFCDGFEGGPTQCAPD